VGGGKGKGGGKKQLSSLEKRKVFTHSWWGAPRSPEERRNFLPGGEGGGANYGGELHSMKEGFLKGGDRIYSIVGL